MDVEPRVAELLVGFVQLNFDIDLIIDRYVKAEQIQVKVDTKQVNPKESIITWLVDAYKTTIVNNGIRDTLRSIFSDSEQDDSSFNALKNLTEESSTKHDLLKDTQNTK